MSSMLIELGEELQLAQDLEERYIVSEVSWEQYEALCSRLGDSLRYRVAYLEELWKLCHQAVVMNLLKLILADC